MPRAARQPAGSLTEQRISRRPLLEAYALTGGCLGRI